MCQSEKTKIQTSTQRKKHTGAHVDRESAFVHRTDTFLPSETMSLHIIIRSVITIFVDEERVLRRSVKRFDIDTWPVKNVQEKILMVVRNSSFSLGDAKQPKMLVKTRLNKQHLNHNLTQLKVVSIAQDDHHGRWRCERLFQGWTKRSESIVRISFRDRFIWRMIKHRWRVRCVFIIDEEEKRDKKKIVSFFGLFS